MLRGVATVKNWSPNIQSLENGWVLHDIRVFSSLCESLLVLCFCFLWSQLYSDPNIVIAKMDATANDIPQGYDVQGYVFSRSSNAL